MNISELIEALSQIAEQHGEILIAHNRDSYGNDAPIYQLDDVLTVDTDRETAYIQIAALATRSDNRAEDLDEYTA